jgi:hypothetical protein
LEINDGMAPTMGCYQAAPQDFLVAGSIDGTEPTYYRVDASTGPSDPCTIFNGPYYINYSGPTNPYPAHHYDTFEIYADATGDYEVAFSSPNYISFGQLLMFSLYLNEFDPNDPCENLLYSSNYIADTYTQSLIEGDKLIVVVTSEFGGNNYSYGPWVIGITPSVPGSILLPVPGCNYTISCYEDVNEIVKLRASDNCVLSSESIIDTLSTTKYENNCISYQIPDNVLYFQKMRYIARDSSENASNELVVTVLVEKMTAQEFTVNVLEPEDYVGADALEKCTEYDKNGYDNPQPWVTGAPQLIIGPDTIPIMFNNTACEISASYVDSYPSPNTSCFRKIMRTWTVMEYGGCDVLQRSMEVFTQIIEVKDSRGPIVSIDSDTITITTNGIQTCGAWFQFPVPEVSDALNCNPDGITWDIFRLLPAYIEEIGEDVSLTNSMYYFLPLGYNFLSYRLTDKCGNITDVDFLVNVVDNTPPVVTCQTFTTVALTYDGEAEVPAHSFDSGSYDDCEINDFKVRRMDQDTVIWNDYVIFDCDDVGNDTLMVVLKVTDKEGNSSECMITVEVQDKLFPIITAPDDIEVSCDWVYNPNDLKGAFGWPEAYDNCEVTVTQDSVTQKFACWGDGSEDRIVKKITRTFTATDGDGRQATDVLVITFVRTNFFGYQYVGDLAQTNEDGYGDILWPKDTIVYGCMSTDYANDETSPLHYKNAGIPTFPNGEGPCDGVGWGIPEDIVVVENDDDLDNDEVCFKIKRKWTVIDDCHKPTNSTYATWEYDQYIIVQIR